MACAKLCQGWPVAFVGAAAAKNLHEAKLLAYGSFKGDKWSTREQRYECAEKELFARMEGVWRKIEYP